MSSKHISLVTEYYHISVTDLSNIVSYLAFKFIGVDI